MEADADHRGYVGGFWDEIGHAQFDAMVKLGLKLDHRFLDLGCGSLRGGRFFIAFLNKGKYYGIDHHQWLIDKGIEEIKEICPDRQPHFIVNETFDFSKFGDVKFDFALAKSLFTHLLPEQIKLCFKNLHPYMKGSLFATVFEGPSRGNPKQQSDRKRFAYMREEIREFAGKQWEMTQPMVQIFDFEPRSRQTLLQFTPV